MEDWRVQQARESARKESIEESVAFFAISAGTVLLGGLVLGLIHLVFGWHWADISEWPEGSRAFAAFLVPVVLYGRHAYRVAWHRESEKLRTEAPHREPEN